MAAEARDKGFRVPSPQVVRAPILLRAWLGQEDRATPALVAVDDLHKHDERLPSALPQLIAEFSSASIVWALARRPGRGGPDVERVFSLPSGEPSLPDTRVGLGPLSESTVRAVTTDLLGAPPSHALEALVATAAGNARLVVELLRGLLEESAVTVVDGMAEVTRTELPQRVHRVVRLLLAEVSPRCRLFIQLAALSGMEFELAAVAEPFEQPAGMLLPLVEEACDVGVIADAGDRLVFTQPLFWQATLDSLPEPMRTGSPRATARAKEGKSESSWPAGLGEIDLMIANLVSHGLTNSQIATRINRSPHTVSYHLRKMFGTLGIRSRSELAGRVRQRLGEAP
ncbi:helix-turn-helix transcriptional regulator [Streptomyces sp. TS71-3]|uniref:helix-turn-helix transcriptional regulator n=1 Tax=Streptomyces sp. TS71-3 TaxID=2733862 RepID=UPI001B28DEC4|nr:helix-turn-helix transcriptional regulator [Streptomyces sp. TS71-3]GHJ37211.1 hypothetical protein Sm713_28200 [Streptomyces sp. TS71-3]